MVASGPLLLFPLQRPADSAEVGKKNLIRFHPALLVGPQSPHLDPPSAEEQCRRSEPGNTTLGHIHAEPAMDQGKETEERAGQDGLSDESTMVCRHFWQWPMMRE